MPTLKTREPATEQPTPEVARPSRHQSRTFIARHPRLIQSSILLTLTGGTALYLLVMLFRGAWAEHKDNFSVLRAIATLELTRQEALSIEDDGQRVVTRSYTTLEPYLAADGWKWSNRFGSTLTFGKQDQYLIASCTPYSPLYLICDLSEIP